jgi:glyoxylase-like metal-dependent hydrolase (beta-lactamase superfamily II)
MRSVSDHFPTLNRRHFVASALAGMSAWPNQAVAENSHSAKLPIQQRNPFVYQFKIGELDAWSISDCHLVFREGLALMWPEEARPTMREEMIRHGESLESIPLYVNILAVRFGKEVALFDAGFGVGNNPRLGWLMEGLAAAGIAAEEVTAGFLSHSHADHLNGFVKDGKPVFPNANVYLLPEELAFWRGENPDFSKSKRDKKPLPGMIKEVRAKFDGLGDKLKVTKDGAEYFNGGVQVIAAPGHTNGHACFRIRSGNEELFHLTDLAHHSLLMFADPKWNIAFDHDPEQAVLTRMKFWKEVSAHHTRCYGFHLPWPGLGRVVADSEARYRWWAEAATWLA